MRSQCKLDIVMRKYTECPPKALKKEVKIGSVNRRKNGYL